MATHNLKSKLSSDPIEVDGSPNWSPNEICLRIGGHGQGEGRYCVLSPLQSKTLAYALLTEAEQLESKNRDS